MFIFGSLLLQCLAGLFGLNIKYFWLEILKESRGLILPIICVITLYYLKFEWTFLTFIVGGSIFAIIYFVSMWLWGLNNNEKSYICNLIKKVVKYKKKKIVVDVEHVLIYVQKSV